MFNNFTKINVADLTAALRQKFPGAKSPWIPWISRWIRWTMLRTRSFLRHLLEFVFLSPAIVITWFCLQVGRREVLITGKENSSISMFIAPLEPELRRRAVVPGSLRRALVLNLSNDANQQVRKMYDEIVSIFGREKRLRRRIIWWASQMGVPCQELEESYFDSMWANGKSVVRFSKEEIDQGEAFLGTIGISGARQFVCYATRTESYYLKRIKEGEGVKLGSVRNPREESYLEVVLQLSRTGLAAIRMGKDLDSSISNDGYSGVIDYASKNRSDFLDVFLLSRCKFLLNGATGIFWIAAMFDIPTVHCDSYDVRVSYLPGDLNIFQKVWLINDRRFANISEMLKMRNQYSQETYQKGHGVELIKNTVEEIQSVVNEMSARLDGVWQSTEDDEILQRRYRDLIVQYSDKPTWQGGGRVGTKFLRQHADLLR